MSFYTSLTGLNAAQTNLSVTSNNIANVGTTGFKSGRAEFGDIVAGSALQLANSPGLGTQLRGIQQQFTQGSFATTDKTLDLAISGQGFFVTRDAKGTGATSLTRAGAFGTDNQGFVTDQSGAYLQVLPVDSNGNASGAGISALKTLQVAQTHGTPKATTTIKQSITLPADAELPASRSVYASNGYAFDPTDSNSYNFATSTTVYDAAGTPLQATTYFVRKTLPTQSDPTSTWDTHLIIGNKEATANGTSPLPLKFDAAGTLTSPTTPASYGAVSPSGAVLPLTVKVDYGTATKQSAGSFQVAGQTQDGVAQGKLSGLTIGVDGLVTATYSDNSIERLGRVAIANVSNPEGLVAVGDSKWRVSATSGDPVVAGANSDGMGLVKSGTLEESNVDVTAQLVKLIQAQRNFQANAKAIDTASQITEVAVNLRS